jgi:hypothetical protein
LVSCVAEPSGPARREIRVAAIILPESAERG